MTHNLFHRRLKNGGKRESGVALLVTLAVITLLLSVTVELHHRIRASVFSTAATLNRRQLDWAAQSGVSIAMAFLLEDKKLGDRDSVQEDWANKEKLQELLAGFPFQDVAISLEITDVLGKMQVNALVKPPNGHEFRPAQNEMWDRFLRPIATMYDDLDLNATTDIINSIKDWLDQKDDDAITGLNGAETDYYESLDPPYAARNGYIDSAEEMLRIKGITPELFYGTEGVPGIGSYVTPFGADMTQKDMVDFPGKINIGTAPLPVLRALLPTESADLAESILEYREERDGDVYLNPLSGDTWHQNAPGCSDLKLDASLITNSSDYFDILCTASWSDFKKMVRVIVHRQKIQNSQDYECKVVAWHSL